MRRGQCCLMQLGCPQLWAWSSSRRLMCVLRGSQTCMTSVSTSRESQRMSPPSLIQTPKRQPLLQGASVEASVYTTIGRAQRNMCTVRGKTWLSASCRISRDLCRCGVTRCCWSQYCRAIRAAVAPANGLPAKVPSNLEASAGVMRPVVKAALMSVWAFAMFSVAPRIWMVRLPSKCCKSVSCPKNLVRRSNTKDLSYRPEA